MEYNRDEALRAKEMAEKKFTVEDFSSAKKFALKAQNLFPELDGINQMIATLDVYQAAEIKVNGENDLYKILSLNASADEETVKKQYRKLALQLHPDKNKSIGAEGAFQLLSEAWSVLSDTNRKLSYDQKRNVKNSNTKNGFHTKRPQKNSTCSVPVPTSNTFWTSCSRCKMQYEYLRVYLNHSLLCPNCHEAFLAVETGFPSNGTGSNFSWTNPQQQKKTKRKNAYGSSVFHHGANVDLYSTQNFQWGACSSATVPSSSGVVHKRGREETQAATRREEALRRKNYGSGSKGSISSSGYHNNGSDGNVRKVGRPPKIRRSITEEIGAQQVFSDSSKTINMDTGMERAACSQGDTGKMRIPTRIYRYSDVNKRSLLMEKAKGEISKKLEEWKVKLADKAKTKQRQKQKDNGNVEIVSKADGDITIRRNNSKHVPFIKEPTDNGKIASVKEVTKSATIVVPDPEFHDFDKDRLKRSFGGDQVWATYDSEDGMPRFYALIQKIISVRPFKLRMSFLNSKNNAEFGPMNWVASGFAKTCGDFRVGRYEVTDTVNIFSHRVQWEKGFRGVVKIFPRKGETWALYKNWSPEWNELTPDNVIHKYDIVEVIDDYNEEQGVLVTPLVKVAGFRAVFHKHMDPNEIKKIPREEMFRFSHQVPSHLLTGEEAQNAPKGCRELDPAAIPSDLLQVITEFKEEEAIETVAQQPI